MVKHRNAVEKLCSFAAHCERCGQGCNAVVVCARPGALKRAYNAMIGTGICECGCRVVVLDRLIWARPVDE